MPYYHLTPARNIPGILTHGLIASVGDRSRLAGEEAPAVYLFVDWTDVQNALMGWLGDAFDENESLAVLEVTDVGGLPVRDGGGFERVIAGSIPADRVRLVCEDANMGLASGTPTESMGLH